MSNNLSDQDGMTNKIESDDDIKSNYEQKKRANSLDLK